MDNISHRQQDTGRVCLFELVVIAKKKEQKQQPKKKKRKQAAVLTHLHKQVENATHQFKQEAKIDHICMMLQTSG